MSVLYMNETICMQLEHRSIRAWQDRKIPEGMVDRLFDVAQRTPSSTGMQSCSVIHVTDPAIKAELVDISGQNYAAAPLTLVFVLDMYRNGQIAAEEGAEFTGQDDYYSFNQAVLDAALMAQNVVVAAESFGLGTVYFGSFVRQATRLAELLELPERTFPIVGLGIGWPAVEPQLKPRLPRKAQIFENKYLRMDNYHELLADYDEEMSNYYDTRDTNRRVDKFTTQVVRRYDGSTLPSGDDALALLKKQKFTWPERGKE